MPILVAAGLILALIGCAPAQPGGPAPTSSGEQPVRRGGTLRLAWEREPENLAPKFVGGSGNAEYQWIFTSTLTYLDASGAAHPMLAQEIPTQANGGWVVNPDGTMVTTYRLRPQAKWHDGTSLTAQDFVFAFEVYTDKDLPVLKITPESIMERVDALDEHTVVIRWKEPYSSANTLGFEQLVPLPRHVFEARYRTSKASFTSGQEWTTSYISTGPFKVERWTPGVSILATAHMDFALGPPRLDAVDIRFVGDPRAEVANLVSNEVDMINTPGIRIQEAVIARDHWGASGEGYIRVWSTGAPYLDWQLRDVPNWQRAMADTRVRQALLHAIDREGINETVNLGFAPLAHTFVSPEDATFPEVDRAITKYTYDVNRAAALLAEAGWQRPAAGGLAATTGGQLLDIELFTTQNQEQQGTIIVDNWRAAGINSNMYVLPQARARDGEATSNFVGARASNRQLGPDNFIWTAAEFATPENRWSGSNRGGFFDAEVERLQSVRVTSLDESQRRQATISLMKRMTELVAPTPFIYAVEVIAARSYVVGPIGRTVGQNGMTWNIHEWEVIR